jgi:hypothetical protein
MIDHTKLKVSKLTMFLQQMLQPRAKEMVVSKNRVFRLQSLSQLVIKSEKDFLRR